VSAGVAGGEVPVDLPLVGVDGVLPGGQLVVEDVEVLDPPVEALSGQGGQLDLGDVEPGAVFRGVVDLQPGGEAARLDRLERLIQGAESVRVEVVHDQDNRLGIGIVDGEQVIDLVGPVQPGPPLPGINASAAGQRFDPDEDRAGAVTDVFEVFPALGFRS
jgi:hypothetical protein